MQSCLDYGYGFWCAREEQKPDPIAQALYQSLGFTEVGIRKDYYPCEHGKEDALLYTLLITPD